MTQNLTPLSQHLEILGRMVDGEDHFRKELESKPTIKEMNLKTIVRKGLAHSTLVKRWEELVEEGSITETETNTITKKGDKMICGKITHLGFLKLLRNSKPNQDQLETILKKFLPDLYDHFSDLMKIFDKKRILELLINTVKGTEVKIYKDIIPETTGIDRFHQRFKGTEVSVYEISMKTNHTFSYWTIGKIFIVKKKKDLKKIQTNVSRELRKMLTGFFIFRLSQGERKKTKYMAPILRNKTISESLQYFMDGIKNRQEYENHALERCKLLLESNH